MTHLIAQPLTVLPRRLAELIEQVPRRVHRHHVPEMVFSIVEHVWHLADLEREAYAHRVERMLAEDTPALPDIDGVELARARRYEARTIEAGLAQFVEARERNLARFAALDARRLARTGLLVGVGIVRIADIPGRMLAHDRSHAGELATLLLAHAPSCAVLPRLHRICPSPLVAPCARRQGHASSYPQRGRLLARVREAIAGRLTDRVPTLDQVARSLGVSARTLQRRLAASGVTFQCLLEEVRRDQTLARIADPRCRIDDLAAALGYSERSAFMRAFRRWTGSTPARFRVIPAEP